MSKVTGRLNFIENTKQISTLIYQQVETFHRAIIDAHQQFEQNRKHLQVLKHIRVERFTVSKRYSTGAVTIEPQLHVDARMQQITMDKRLASLPPGLQSLNLFSILNVIVSTYIFEKY